jgi:hypothetical protein
LAILAFALLVAVFFTVSFGLTRLLLRHSAFEDYTFEAALFATPMLTALVFSLGGYYHPESLSALSAWTFVLAGAALSIGVAIRDRRSIRVLLHEHGRRLLFILAGAAWAAVALMLFFPCNEWTEFYYLANHEYLNYVKLAGVLTGQFQPMPDLPDSLLEAHPSLRYGQDLITATVSQIAGRHPINMVLPLSIFFRFQYAIALGILLFRLVGPRSWVVPLLLFLDGVLLPVTWSFTSAFMSSNCTLPIFLIYFGILHTERLGWREVTLLVLCNVYFLITYPEFFPVAKVLEIALLGVWLVRRQSQRWRPVVLANLLVCSMHPLLVLRKIDLAFRLTNLAAGGNFFGDPRRSPLTYLANLLGLRYAWSTLEPFARYRWAGVMIIALVLSGICAGLYLLAARHRLAVAVISWTLLVAAFHVKPFILDEAIFYCALKFVAQTTIVPLLALLALCQVKMRVLRWGACFVAAVWASAATFSTFRIYSQLPPADGLHYSWYLDALARHKQNGPPLAVLGPPPILWMSFLAAREVRLPFQLLSREQYAQLFFIDENTINEQQYAPRGRTLFEGLVIADPIDQPTARWGRFEFEPDEVLETIGRQRLYRGRIRYPSSMHGQIGWFVIEPSDWEPSLFAAGRRLVLVGEVPSNAGFTMPYRFTVQIPRSNWSAEVKLNSPGPFEVAVSLPEDVVGRFISLKFIPRQTCATELVIPEWKAPTTKVGFRLRRISIEADTPSLAAQNLLWPNADAVSEGQK